VTEDLTEAKVFYVAHGSEAEQQSVADAFAANAGRIRSHVSRSMRLRHTPSLRFVYDKAIEEGAKIDRLLQEVRKKEGW
jgi:ribosome-binding factor A